MKKIKFLIILILTLVQVKVNAQETKTLVSTDFTIRDFSIYNDSVFFIKKRDVHLYDLKTKTSNEYFIGGYGLEMATNKNSNYIITASNELVRNVCSVRFYNKKTKTVEDVFYYKEAKILDFVLIPEAQVFAISLTNKKIIIINYQDKPKFYKTIEIKLNSLSRKIIIKDKNLYFATDNGNIYEYDFLNYKKKLLYNAKKLITDFIVVDDTLLYSTIDGFVTKVNLKSKTILNIKFDNNFVSSFLLVNNKIICGTWNGKIFILDINKLTIEKEFNFHKRAILKIKKYGDNIFSCSLDKTIKSWKIN